MPASNLQSIFLGVTPSTQRKFILASLAHLRTKGFERVVIPAAGQFTLARCALAAGFEPKQIITSDISFYSSMLGYLYAGKPLSTLGMRVHESVTIGDEQFLLEQEIEKLDDVATAAYILWLIKLCQLRENLFEQMMFREYVQHGEKYRKDIERQLRIAIGHFAGIEYRIRDLRSELADEWNEKTVIVVNPPAYSAGSYGRMFPIDKMLDFAPEIPGGEFVWSKEYRPLYHASMSKPYTSIWYKKNRELDGLPKDQTAYALQLNKGEFDLWLCTKPDELRQMRGYGAINYKPEKRISGYRGMSVWPSDGELRRDSKIVFVKVGEEHSLYYRDLFAHRLGNTMAEMYFLMLVDNKVFGTIGFHCSDWNRGKSTMIFEVFGFNAPSSRYPTLNRLLMLCLTCTQMRDVLVASISRFNRFRKMTGLKTTCLSKYRKLKANIGILDVVKADKEENGLYKLVYEADFREETFSEALGLFLDEVETGKRGNFITTKKAMREVE